jgi:hypothetical protein
VAGNKEVALGFKRGSILMVGIAIDGPNKKQIGQSLKVAMSGKYSIRQAIEESHPTARLVKDLIRPPMSHKQRHSAVGKFARTVLDAVTGRQRQRIQINERRGPMHAVAAYLGLCQLLNLQHTYSYKAAFLSPEPKTQFEARKRPDSQDWINAEWIEMDTVYSMGTIKYVPVNQLPPNITLIPTKFAYKCKFGDEGQIVKKKARLCVRGDLQYDSEYTETYAPTSRFNTLRTLISVAAQDDLKLVQFDVKGAFMVADINDQDIHIELPQGYSAPEGHVAKLSRSLYGLRDAAY